jgi:hypothetical protein
MIRGAGGEQFDVGVPVSLWGIFDRPSVDSFGQLMPVKNRHPIVTCRESDARELKLVKGSRIRRLADDASYTVRDLEPDGCGMTVLILGA